MLASGGGVPDPRASLRFFALGGLSFAALGLVLPRAVAHLESYRHNPWLLMAVHLLVLTLTALEMGAIYQMAPALLAQEPASRRQAALQPPLLAAGMVLMLLGFRYWQPVLLAAGGVLVLAAAVWFALLVTPGLLRALPQGATPAYLFGAVLSLLLVVALGVTLALNLRFRFLPAGAGTQLGAHFALGAGGWFGLAVIGMSYRMSGMFYMVRHDLPFTQAGWLAWVKVAALTGLAAALLFGHWPLARLLLATVAVLGLIYVAAFAHGLLHRQRRVVDITLWHMVAADAGLLLVCAGLLAVAAGWSPLRWFWPAMALALLAGWTGNMVMGVAHRILPFLIWYVHFAPLAGKMRVPTFAELLPRRLPATAFSLWNTGLVGLLVALLTGAAPAWKMAAGTVTGAGSLAFAATAVAVLRRRPQG